MFDLMFSKPRILIAKHDFPQKVLRNFHICDSIYKIYEYVYVEKSGYVHCWLLHKDLL